MSTLSTKNLPLKNRKETMTMTLIYSESIPSDRERPFYKLVHGGAGLPLLSRIYDDDD